MENARPQELAILVQDKLKKSKRITLIPELGVLNNLFECLFFTSMCKEESELIKVTVTFIDPANPDPHPPRRSVAERWSCISFDQRIPMTTKSLAKLSKAADPSCTSLAVYYDDHGLFIWGMIDQAMQYQNFLNYESENDSEQPGFFQVSIKDIGTLNILFDYELLATLNQNVLVQRYLDVLTIGPVAKILKRNSDFLKIKIREYLLETYPEQAFQEWEDFLDNLWIQTLSRLLLKIQNYQHGGALLIADESADIDIKYKIHYQRLIFAMIAYAKASIENHVLDRYITAQIHEGKRSISKSLYQKESAALLQKAGIADEITGAINFIASQTCVDGVVLFNRDMVSNGFGAVLRAKRMPRKIYVSATATATAKSLSAADPKDYGTRHRSMIAYCWNHPTALGLVISQDGEIRAFSKIEDKLIMWEKIKTQQYIKNKKL
ncbi:hypothetical protein SAMN06265348_10124 [Pedobacter westerhofensis]|uniref:Probable sensor domain-containing protein n=1 Tax=Pedobacter westerhofensis TaxID=425512 RepID=A0A521ABE7_9SPHI|nr:hypothetical protein [Pedobacter westerhofensis]SMO32081.1 hypothetical protein SAMN06265348_10124 [Pedobacter westerhofensis]